jgi:predicted RecA/RadA family phage recombinase
MGNEMIDLMAGDARLRSRLEAYAEYRLTPELAASSRIRARVLAVAHRQADLARADAALTIVTEATERAAAPVRPRTARWRRPLVAFLAASLAVGAAAGSTFAARPGGSLYETRLWLETLTLPSDPPQRALAELVRLRERLQEARQAVADGDVGAVAAALAAYESIMEEASAAAISAGDEVAIAALQAGVGHNVDVLQALILALPDQATDAIERAVQRAIDRSDSAIERIDRGHQEPDSNPVGAPAHPTAKPTQAPTPAPPPKPTRKPTGDDPQGGGQPAGGSAGEPPASTHEPGKPAKSPRPEPQHQPD